MSSQSPHFNLTIPSLTDTASVITYIANNLSSIDSILSVAHTGAGALKPGQVISSGTVTGAVITGGSVIPATLGTTGYILPSTIGGAGEVITVNGSTVSWQPVSAPGTGANDALSNLAAVSINTSLNNFTAGTVVFNSVKATAGTMSGLTSIAATTGVFNALTATAGTLSGLTSLAATTGNFTTITAGGIKLVNNITTFSTDGTMAANSDSNIPTEKAIRTYVTTSLFHPSYTFVSSGSASTDGVGGGTILLPIVVASGERYKLSVSFLQTNAAQNYNFGVVTARMNTGGMTTTIADTSSGANVWMGITDFDCVSYTTRGRMAIYSNFAKSSGANVVFDQLYSLDSTVSSVTLACNGGTFSIKYAIYKYATS